jgi:hypothetical protein
MAQRTEPWDAGSPYYLIALLALGVAVGLLQPAIASIGHSTAPKKRTIDIGYLLAVYLGAFIGQVAYMVAFVPAGPLLLVGVLFLAGYSMVALTSCSVVAALRWALSAGAGR